MFFFFFGRFKQKKNIEGNLLQVCYSQFIKSLRLLQFTHTIVG